MPWGLLWQDMTPSYRLAFRTTEVLWRGGGESSQDLSCLFQNPRMLKLKGSQKTPRPTLLQGFFPSQGCRARYISALNSVLTTGHQRKRPQFYLQLLILGCRTGLGEHSKREELK